MRLRGQLFLSYLAVTVLGVLLVGAYLLVSFQHFELRAMRLDLDARATALSENTEDGLARDDLEHVRVIVRRYGAQEDIWLRVFDADGRLVASSSPWLDVRTKDWRAVPGVASALAGKATHGRTRGTGVGDAGMYEARPLTSDGRRVGVLLLSRTLTMHEAQRRRAELTVALAVLAALAVCAAVSARLARRVADPARRMRDFAVAVGEGRYDRRLPTDRADEFGDLARALNAMSARLGSLEGERRAFLANASHELRTPVTNVLATLEALEGGAADEPALRAQFLRTAAQETSRLATLVEALLDLGRLEAGVASLERRDVDLARVAERCAEALGARLAAAGVSLDLALGEAWTVADPERLAQAVLNLLDNALRHSPAGGALHVATRTEDDAAVLEVRDEGRGIAAADLPHVFEQFYTRGPERAHGGGGVGLGLAIVRRVVEVHGGVARASNAPEGGALFALRLPLRGSRDVGKE